MNRREVIYLSPRKIRRKMNHSKKIEDTMCYIGVAVATLYFVVHVICALVR